MIIFMGVGDAASPKSAVGAIMWRMGPNEPSCRQAATGRSRFRLAEVKNRLRASYGNFHPPFQEFHRAYLQRFDATASIDEGYVDDAGLVCDLADVPGHLFPDAQASAEAFWRRHRLVPVNHMVAIRRDLAERHPDLVPELLRMFREAKAVAPLTADGRDPLPFGRGALEPAVELALRYAAEQSLLLRDFDAGEVWEGLPPGMK